MASTATPYGLEPVGTLSGSGSFSGKVRQYPIASGYATNIFYGDVVEIVAGGGVEREADTALTDATLGIFLGCQYTDSTLGFVTRQMWPASTVASDAVALVCDDPHVLFRIQADGTVAAADRGQCADLVLTAGSTSIGRSKAVLNQSSLGTSANLAVKIIDFVEDGDNTAGDAFTDVICRFNAHHFYFDQIAGI